MKRGRRAASTRVRAMVVMMLVQGYRRAALFGAFNGV